MSTPTTHMLYPQLNQSYPLAVRAEGSYVYDQVGRSYLDGCSGAIVMNLGHGVTEIIDAIQKQLKKITFSYRHQFTNPPAEQLAAELVELAPGDLQYVFFTNSGSEAIEAAVRLALQYWQEVDRPERTVMVSRDGSYHGATLGAIALSGHPVRRRPVEPILPAWPRAVEANCHACPFGLTRSSCRLECAQSIEKTILVAGPDRVAAVVIEPVVGASGGAVPAPAGYLREVAEICHRHDVLLIADEVITGLGRTGRWFGCDEEAIAPDLLVLGKGLSAGYAPLGAVLTSTRIQAAISAGSGQFALGHTYAANPMSTAVGLAVLRYVRSHNLPARAHELGPKLAARLRRIVDERGLDADVRGRGLLLAVDFTPPGGTADGSGPTATDVVAAAKRRGLLLYPAGTGATPRTVIVSPPLTITPDELDHLVELFATALDDLDDQRACTDQPQMKGAVR
jgi:adenosylmethionine-8-amino-7-oxononanoate aminotransferase